METPDKWVVVKIKNGSNEPYYKVFATWYGGYLDGDSWRMNSGIARVESDDNYFYFYGHSGSCYKCNKSFYGTNSYSTGVLKGIIDKGQLVDTIVEIMDADSDWINLFKNN